MIEIINMRTMLLLVSILLGFLSACSQEDSVVGLSRRELSDLDLKLDFSRVTKNGEPRLQVQVSFMMPRAQMGLSLPDTFMRKEALYQRIENLEVLSGGSVGNGKDNSIKILQAPVGQRVSYRYLIRSYQENADKNDSFSAPIIWDDYFQFVGSMGLVMPLAFRTNEELNLKVQWDMPSGHQVYNSFGAQESSQSIQASGMALMDAVFIGGSTIRAQQYTVRGRPVTIALQGTWDKISDRDFADVLTRLLEKQRETWGDDNFPHFLVSITALGDGCTPNKPVKYVGTAHVNSFRAYFPGACDFKPDMKQLISHELMHMWIGKKIKVGALRGHIDGKWFTEGFTDYYGRILAYRAGVLSEADYFSTLNRQVEKYSISDERQVRLAELVDRMYRKRISRPTNSELEMVPYQQGEVLAWRLNKRIKVETKGSSSLDDVIHDLLSMAASAGGAKNFSIDEIAKSVNRFAPGIFMAEYDKINNGGFFNPPKLEDCAQPTSSNYLDFSTENKQYSNKKPLAYRTIKSGCSKWLQ